MLAMISSLPAGLALGLMLGAGRPHPRGLVLASLVLWVAGWWL